MLSPHFCVHFTASAVSWLQSEAGWQSHNHNQSANEFIELFGKQASKKKRKRKIAQEVSFLQTNGDRQQCALVGSAWNARWNGNINYSAWHFQVVITGFAIPLIKVNHLFVVTGRAN